MNKQAAQTNKKVLLHRICKLLKAFITFPFAVLAHFRRLLRLSISSKIIFGYILMYVLSCVLLDMSLLIVFGKGLSREFTSEGEVYAREITVRFNEHSSNAADIRDILNGTEIIGIVLDENGTVLSRERSDQTAIELRALANQRVEAVPLLRRLLPLTVLPEGYYRQELRFTTSEKKTLIIELYHSLMPYRSELDLFALIGLVFAAGQLIGALMLWIFGAVRTGRMLRPIKDMTEKTKVINGENLDIRLDVEKAQYELKDLAITINAMMERIETAYSRQRRFVSDVSHELRTPIAVVKGYADMLDRWGKYDAKITQEAVDAIKNEAENMRGLIEKLLFLVRYDNAALMYHKARVCISSLVSEVAAETRMLDQFHQVNAAIAENVYAHVDALRLKQVLRILVDNALKYTPPGGEVVLKLEMDAQSLRITVKDTGRGISKKDLPHIFDRFYRADLSRTRNTGGHGLGLSIAKAIVFDHEGHIRVRSKENTGSEFELTFKREEHYSMLTHNAGY